MIIVEGSDKVGKTTLCKSLSQTNGRIIHFGILPDDWDFFWDYSARADLRTIWDRGWLSEIAYQSITGRPKRLTQEHRISVMHALRLFAVVNVIVVCDHDLLLQRLSDCADDKFDKATVLAVNQWYSDNWMSYGTDIIIRCDKRKPYPSRTDIARIDDLHERRIQIVRDSIGLGLCLAKRPNIARAVDHQLVIGSNSNRNEKQPG